MGALSRPIVKAMAVNKNSSNGNDEPRETIMQPGCDYNHCLIVMEFPKDPAPTREQMIDTYLNMLATVLGRFTPEALSLQFTKGLVGWFLQVLFLKGLLYSIGSGRHHF